MYKKFLFFFCIAFALSCSRVPITGRKQVNLLAESDLMKMSLVEYTKFLAAHSMVPDTDPQAMLIRKVGANIQAAVVKYMNANKKYKKRIAGSVSYTHLTLPTNREV